MNKKYSYKELADYLPKSLRDELVADTKKKRAEVEKKTAQTKKEIEESNNGKHK